MAAVLKITDGSEEVNLIDEQAGFILKEWIPAIPTYKNGGVFVDSPLVEGRRLVSKQFGNVTDTFRVDVREAGQDALIAQLQTLRQLLEKAANYWVTEWQTEPVWLEAQASCESNKRYAIIYMGSLPEDDNFYSQPFIGEQGRAAMDDLSLVIEHGIWQDVEPGQEGNALEISSESVAPDNVTYGQEASTSGAFVVNKYAPDDQLTHIYYYDASLAAWSANLINAAVPFALTPNPTEAGDIIYFGVEDPGFRYVNFTNLIFDIGTVSSNITTAVWEYYDGSAWQDLSETDDTSNFTVAGVGVVTWSVPADFTKVVINGVTAYWIRFRVTVIGGVVTRPTQQNRYVYTQVVPYVSVDYNDVSGDIPILIKCSVAPEDSSGINRVIFGTRSKSRGEDFSAFLNVTDHNLPPGITFSIFGLYRAYVRNAPSGECAFIENAPASWNTYFYWTLDNSIACQYHGVFRAFMRGYQSSGSAGDIKIKLRYYYTSTTHYTETNPVPFRYLIDGEYIDLGRIELPPSNYSHDIIEDQIGIGLQLYGNTTSDCYLYDLILIPIDESSGEYFLENILGVTSNSRKFHFGTLYPKTRDMAFVTNTATGYVTNYYQSIQSQSPFLQPNSDQKMWFFMSYYYTSWYSSSRLLDKITVRKYQRYLSARGDK